MFAIRCPERKNGVYPLLAASSGPVAVGAHDIPGPGSVMRELFSQLFFFLRQQRDGWPLSLHITLLTVVIIIPLLMLAGLTISGHIATTRQSLHQDTQKVADGVVVSIEREVSSVMTLLNLLAQDTAFDRGEYEALYTRAKEGLKQRKGYVALVNREGKPLFSTRFEYGTPLPVNPADMTGDRVIETGRPMVSNVYFGRAAQQEVFGIIVPILRGGHAVGRFHLVLTPADFIEVVNPSGIVADWTYSIADRNLAYVLSSDPGNYPTAAPVKKEIVDRITADSGQFRVMTPAGEPLLMAYRKSSLTGWTAFSATPVALAEQPLMRLWRNFVLAGTALLAISLLAAYAFSRAMALPIQSLAQAAAAFGEGHDMPVLHSTLREANLLSSAFSHAAIQLRGRSQALTESERRFRLFAGQTNDVIWFADVDRGRFDYVSPAFEAISGRPAAQIVTLQHWRSMVYPDDISIFEPPSPDDFDAGELREYRISRPDGELRWVQDTRFPLEAAPDKPRIMAGILRDVTARKAAVNALKSAQAEAEARLEELENLYRSAPIGLALLDAECRVVRLNAFLAAMSTRPADPFTNRPFFEMFPQLEEAAKPRCEQVLQDGIAVSNLEIETDRQAAGGPQYFLAHFYPIHLKSTGMSGIGVILENITERKRTAQVLARLAAIVYAANDSMFSFAPTGRIQNWNPASEILFQYGEDEAVGRPFSMLFPQGGDDDYQKLLKAWEMGESLRLDTDMLRKDGSVFPASISIAPIRSGGSRPIAISTTIEDITERRNWEKRQLLMNRELAHRVKNTLAVIQAMARHTLRTSADPAAFTAAFEGRLRALSISHNLLTSSQWDGVEIGEVIREQLAPHGIGGARFRLDGPPIMIPPGMVTSLGLVLHELGTNAAKYGALSAPGGNVTLVWRVLPSSPHKMLAIEWTERGGPTVQPPTHQGFGSVLIDSSGKVARFFEPEGVRCTIEMPLMEGGEGRAY
jgi:PAS domain S-box-containing protein